MDRFNASFPPTSSLHTIWKPAEQLPTLPSEIHVTMRRPHEALNCIAFILSALANNAFDNTSPSASFIDVMSPRRILEHAHRLLDCFGRLANHRCLDRRKLVACLEHILSKFVLNSSFKMCQQLTDLLARTLALISPSDSQDLQRNISDCLLKMSSEEIFIQIAKRSTLERLLTNYALDLTRFSHEYQVSVFLHDKIYIDARRQR
jgi:hypothetical protein